MGKHTTPGLDTPGTRDDVVGWGAFSTLVAVILVGLFAGWFEAFGVLLLGGLATAALWFARSRAAAAAAARGRHASETPWSATDLLELKDAEGQQPAPEQQPAAPQAGARTGRRSAPPEPGPTGADALAWLPGQPTRGRRAAGPPAGAPPVPIQGGAADPAELVVGPPSRRSRRGDRDRTEQGVAVDAGSRGVLPVAPFEMGQAVPGPAPAPTLPGVQVPAGALPAASMPVAPMPVAPMPVLPARVSPDPLSGPLNLDAVAAEPTVLDPALDPLWPAPERSVADRAAAAATLDPLWARRARRPQLRRAGADRPVAVRREPAPLEPIPPTAGPSSEPYLVVLPEPDVTGVPDVPDVLMLPESDVVQPPDVPASRPAPGTLSLDELLVLHTRRPGGRRSASDDRSAEDGGRRLE